MKILTHSIILFIFLIIAPAVSSSEEISIDTTAEIFLGAGYDSESGELKDTCLVQKFPDESTESIDSNIDSGIGEGLPSVYYNIYSITSRSELEKKLNITASASFKMGSASATFSNNLKMDSFSAHALVQVLVVAPTQNLANVKMSQDAVTLLNGGEEERFRRVCGDMFVTSVIRGGELNGLVTIFTKTQEETRQLQASASGITEVFLVALQ